MAETNKGVRLVDASLLSGAPTHVSGMNEINSGRVPVATLNGVLGTIASAEINEAGNVIFHLNNGQTVDAGQIDGVVGPPGSIEENSSLNFTGAIAASLTANTVNWSPSGLNNASTLLVSADDKWTLSGLVPVNGAGSKVYVYNAGTKDFTFLSESSTSTAANRFAIGPAKLRLRPREGIALWYDGAASRWRASGHSRMPEVTQAGAQTGFKAYSLSSGGHRDIDRHNQTVGGVYPGSLISPNLWTRNLDVDGSGNIVGEINWPKSRDEEDWLPFTYSPTTGMVWDAAWKDKYLFAFIQNGNSTDRGAVVPGTSAYPILTDPIDSINAFMPKMTNLSVQIPMLPIGAKFGTTGTMTVKPMASETTQGSSASAVGESPLPIMMLATLQAMQTNGSRQFMIGAGFGQGGHRLIELMSSTRLVGMELAEVTDGTDSNMDKRGGGRYEEMLSGIQHMADYARSIGKKLVLIHIHFGHGANDIAQSMNGRKYGRFLKHYSDDLVRDVARILDFSPDAPPTGMILTQDCWRSTMLQPDSSVRIFDIAYTTPGMAMWALCLEYPDRFIMAGPGYWAPVGTDNAHYTSSSYLRIGEMRYRAGYRNLAQPPRRIGPKAVIRVSSTVTKIIMAGGSYELSTAQVSDPGNYGFVMFKAAEKTEVAISSVVIGLPGEVIITHAALPNTPNRNLVIRYAAYAANSDPSTGNGPLYGARGCLRETTAYVSRLGSYEDPTNPGNNFPAVSDYDYVPQFQIVTTEASNRTQYDVDGDIF